jgi:hypothetical protein
VMRARLAAAMLVVAGLASATVACGQYFEPPGGLAAWQLSPYGDLRLRFDLVHDRPGQVSDLRRVRAAARSGLAWRPAGSPWSAEGGVLVSFGSETNVEALAAFDNEAPDTLDVDRLAVRWQSAAGHAVHAGKAPLPLALTEMVWDRDLRPVGIAASVVADPSPALGLRLVAGGFQRSRLDGRDGRVLAAQAGAHYRPAGLLDAEALVAWLGFDDLHHLARRGMARQNATVGGLGGARYAARFRVLDAQLAVRGRALGMAAGVRLDVARNLARDAERDAIRFRVALGGAEAPAGLEGGWTFQRIAREALPGAFNSDEWWFHSRTRGQQVWLQAGTGRRAALRIAGFRERRDDLAHWTERVTAELTLRLDPP